MFLQSHIAEVVPKSATIPNISCYLLVALLLSAFNVASNTLVFTMEYMQSKSKPPLLIYYLLRLLSVLVFYKVKENCKAMTRPRSDRFDLHPELQTGGEPLMHGGRSFVRHGTRLNPARNANWHHLAIIFNRIFSVAYIAGSIASVYYYLSPLKMALERGR